jgi:hypothetical protein
MTTSTVHRTSGHDFAIRKFPLFGPATATGEIANSTLLPGSTKRDLEYRKASETLFVCDVSVCTFAVRNSRG